MVFKPRSIPTPNHISPEAQAVLNKDRDFKYGNMGELSHEEWAQWRDKTNKFFGENRNKIIAKAKVTLTPKKLGNVTAYLISPHTINPDYKDNIILQFHGGGYMVLGGYACVVEGTRLAANSGINVMAVDYRVTPEHVFPAAYDDALTAYSALLKDYKGSQISVEGTSAGGGLAACLILAARQAGLPLPASVAFNTPWTDLTGSGDSYNTIKGLDPILQRWEGGLEGMAKLYAGDTPRNDPRISPVFADCSGEFPPSVLVTGTRDLFLSDTVRLHRALRQAGHISELHVFEAGWHGLGFTPEANEASIEMTNFMKRYF